MNEAEWQTDVQRIATEAGWKWLRVRRMGDRYGWRTPTTGPLGTGWPDLLMVRGSRLLAAELKAEGGKLEEEQAEVLRLLELAGAEVHVWWPRDIDNVMEALR